MLNLILFGPPGAGKGTHSVRLAEKYGLVHFSTGDFFRNEIKNMTELGKKAKVHIDKGELVPDDIVNVLLFFRLEKFKLENGFIFDGFPRTIFQAKKLDEMLGWLNIPVPLVIFLEVPEEELVHRMINRGKDSNRTDDNSEIIHQRLQVYNKQTKPLLDYYAKKNQMHTIHGLGSIDEIFAQICQTIESSENFKR
jgi:adenylate kinase